jgi:NAD(P)H dehydrogenase (quinone)
LAKAFAEAERLLLISTDAVGQLGRRLEQHQVAIAAAKQAGVKHVVYTSIAGADASKMPLAYDHLGTENALKASGLGWTLLRNNLYVESALFNLMQLPQAIASGKLVTATGDGGAAFITREDCARAAAAALMAATQESRTLEIAGPAAVTGKEIAQLASDITGRKVAFESIPAAALKAGLAQHGLPQPIVDLVVDFHTSIANRELASISPDFKALTGQPAGSVAAFLQANKQSLLQSA